MTLYRQVIYSTIAGMSLLKTALSIFTEALFPFSPAEKELFSYSPESACEILPPAPAFTGLAVPLPEAHAVFAYKDKRVEKLVWNIKYKKSALAVKIGGYALWRELVQKGEPSHIILIPMPITDRRRRERGFNQCELLVDEIAKLNREKENGRPNISLRIEKDTLTRTHHASRQTLKGRADRVESAKGVFAVNELNEKATEKSAEKIAEQFKDSTIIIIDDVITTGSTMREAIDTLKAAGFENVHGLALAH